MKDDLLVLLERNVDNIKSALKKMNIEAIARESGFLKRTPRKISMRNFLLGLISLSACSIPALERIANAVGRSARRSYSKQALHKRLSKSLYSFLAKIAVNLFGNITDDVVSRGLFSKFKRVLIQDSTNIALPDRYTNEFPGSKNQHKQFATIKIQFIFNVLCSNVLHLSLSGFTRNDQAAAMDIIDIVKKGDLVLRDLGYFVTDVFRALIEKGAFFLSRYHHTLTLLDPKTRRLLNIKKLLEKYSTLDQIVLLGAKEQLPVRLVAIPVPDQVSNYRRRKAYADRRNKQPSSRHIFLLGWNIFITNVDKSVWPAKVFSLIYRTRWHIEMIFKAWKSHLGIKNLNTRSINLIYLSIMIRLIFCVFIHRTCSDLEMLCINNNHVSLLRIAKIFSDCAVLFEAAVLNIQPLSLLTQILRCHSFYEHRRDRLNLIQLLHNVCRPLG